MQFADYANRYTSIHFAREEGVLEMTFHTRGGEALWGVTEQSLHAELGHASQDIASDRENRVVIITGTGHTFLMGQDPEAPPPEKSQVAMWNRIFREGVALLNTLLEIPVPVIAAVNGPVLIHAEIPALSDIVLAADHAEFADLAHAPNGVVPGDGVHTVWPMLIGPNRARYFLLTGERISAQEAQRLGFVAEVHKADALMPRARMLARQLAGNSPMMLRHTRALFTRELRRRMRDELELGLAFEALAAQAGAAGAAD